MIDQLIACIDYLKMMYPFILIIASSIATFYVFIVLFKLSRSGVRVFIQRQVYRLFRNLDDPRERYMKILLLMFPITIALSLMIHRILYFTYPFGNDTPVYMFIFKNLDRIIADQGFVGGVKYLISIPNVGVQKIASYLLYYILWKALSIDILLFMEILPILVATLYVFSLEYMTYRLSSSYFMSFLAGLFGSTWSVLIRHSYEHFANLLGVSLLFIIVGLRYSIGSIGRNRFSYKVLYIFLVVLMTVSYQYSCIVLLGILILDQIILFILGVREHYRGLYELLTTSTILLILISISHIINPIQYANYLSHRSPYSIKGLLLLGKLESYIMAPLLMLFPFLVIYRLRRLKCIDKFLYVLLLNTSTVTLLIILSPNLKWRIWIYLLAPVITAYTLYHVLNKLVKITGSRGKKVSNTIITSTLTLIITLQVVYAFTYNILPGFAALPPSEVIENFKLIEGVYGFSNRTIYVYVNAPKIYYHRWALAIVGDNVIAGNRLLDKYVDLWFNDRASWRAKVFNTVYVNDCSLLPTLGLLNNRSIVIPASLLDRSKEYLFIKSIGLWNSKARSYIISQDSIDKSLEKAVILINGSSVSEWVYEVSDCCQLLSEDSKLVFKITCNRGSPYFTYSFSSYSSYSGREYVMVIKYRLSSSCKVLVKLTYSNGEYLLLRLNKSPNYVVRLVNDLPVSLSIVFEECIEYSGLFEIEYIAFIPITD